ncbi:hypothetical protein BDW59DRAFT_145069 [Aspergillus cavernicola]|uniref:SCP domain-containing protein n=1 Tax=Aspergillus cavernicola TaxID=176166 RepID=A0ABR4IIQ3_9EURO
MKLATIIALFPVLYPLVYGAAISPRSPIEGYTIWQPEWEIEASPGKTIKARGTIEQARDELLKVNPNWDEDYVEPAKAKRALEARSELAKRTDFYTDGRVECRGRWEETNADEIQRGILYLQALGGQPTNGPGPGACGRVSCSFGAAIYWCNDETTPKTLESYSSIADGAQAIINDCKFYKPGSYNKASGQAFHKTNWNVIVRKDLENC